MGRQEEIVEAARKIAINEGINAVSVRRVATEVGIGASTLRYYFPSNRELFAALSDTTVGDLLNDGNLADETIPADERLTDLLMQLLPQTPKSLVGIEASMSAFRIAFTSGELTGHETLRATVAESEMIVKRWLTELEKQGEAFALDLDNSAKHLLTVANGLMIDLVTHAPLMTLEDARSQLRTAVRLLLQ